MTRGRSGARAVRLVAALSVGVGLAAAASARADVAITGGHYQLNTTNSARTKLADNINQVEHPVFPVTGRSQHRSRCTGRRPISRRHWARFTESRPRPRTSR